MQPETSKKLVNEFLSDLKTVLEQKRFKLDLKLIRRGSHLYRFNVKHKAHFFFIHVSGAQYFLIPSPRQDISRLISSENIDYVVMLLKQTEGGKHPSGFLIPGDDFTNMQSGFTINRMGLIKIKEEDLSLKYQFDNWDSLFKLLNL
jgi:hypothetical protein